MTTINTTANITIFLAQLSDAKLDKELARVRGIYQGEQVRYLPDSAYDIWQAHIELIEGEIERRG